MTRWMKMMMAFLLHVVMMMWTTGMRVEGSRDGDDGDDDGAL